MLEPVSQKPICVDSCLNWYVTPDKEMRRSVIRTRVTLGSQPEPEVSSEGSGLAREPPSAMRCATALTTPDNSFSSDSSSSSSAGTASADSGAEVASRLPPYGSSSGSGSGSGSGSASSSFRSRTTDNWRFWKTEGGRSGSKALCGGLIEGKRSFCLPLSFVGDELVSGGADIDLRVLGSGRAGADDLRARVRTGEGRTGEDESWNTLLSSQPDSGSSVIGRAARLA